MLIKDLIEMLEEYRKEYGDLIDIGLYDEENISWFNITKESFYIESNEEEMVGDSLGIIIKKEI